MRNYRKDGSFFWNELRASPVYDEKGRLVNFVGVQNDVLGRRKGEEERDLFAPRRTDRQGRGGKEEAGASGRGGATLTASLQYSSTVACVAYLTVPESAD